MDNDSLNTILGRHFHGQTKRLDAIKMLQNTVAAYVFDGVL
ncbi:hypothetical protein LBMAG21_08900 [Armatimonadota bacterium]|nr:hypothetical protein LBMAG21_08900 [Armatimonadota bacterium]